MLVEGGGYLVVQTLGHIRLKEFFGDLCLEIHSRELPRADLCVHVLLNLITCPKKGTWDAAGYTEVCDVSGSSACTCQQTPQTMVLSWGNVAH